MALRYGYFDSDIIGIDSEGMPIFDRAETSDLFALLFSRLVSDGVLAQPANCFQVLGTGTGLSVEIQPGFGMVKGHFAYDDEKSTLTIESAPQRYSRIDRVVMRCNYLDRMVEIVIKTGTEANNPVPPELTRPSAGDYFELCLANIRLAAGQKSITQSSITDTRPNSSVCGYITQLIDHLDTGVFFEQLNKFYEEFVNKSETSYEYFSQMFQNTYNELTAQMNESFANLIEQSRQKYEAFDSDISKYIVDLRSKGDSDLATITQQLLDFKNENQAAFLEWFENVKEMLGTDPAGKLQNQINGLISRIDDLSGMLYSGMMLADLITDDGDLITDDAGNIIVVDWPICGCQKNIAQGGY